MKSFASDNNSGVHPEILNAIFNANLQHAVGYGDDEWTRQAEQKFKELFGTDTETLFVFNGTGANITALQLCTRPYHSILCTQTAHILVDECGAPAKATGCPLFPIQSPDGKLTPELIQPFLKGFGDQHHSQPGVIYISQCTELGTVYTAGEVRAICKLAHEYGLYVHMDGARIANAVASLGMNVRALTVDCGVDILSFGGTKNGMMMGEAVVIFNKQLQKEARFVRKQSAQLASKMRYLAAQFLAYLQDDLWLKNAEASNKLTLRLKDKLSEFPSVTFTQPIESNAIFLKLPKNISEEMLKKWFFYYWNEAEGEIRLVCSFDTTEKDIDLFINDLKYIITNY